jgi:threonine/homoserine/homoserine lactone efflux protein
MLRSKRVSSKDKAVKTPDSTVDVKKMFRQGFICNVTNPKATIFILSIFLQIIDKETPVGTQMLYGVLISFIHLIWFSFLTFGFSKIAKHRLADRMRNYIEKISGGVLVLLGVKLLASAKN